MLAQLEDTELSDHKMMRLQVRFIKDHTDVDLNDMPSKITQADIRKTATSQKTINRIKDMDEILSQSMMEIIRDDIPRRPLIDQWYNQPQHQIRKDKYPSILLERDN